MEADSARDLGDVVFARVHEPESFQDRGNLFID